MNKFKILFVFIVNTIILCSCSEQKDEEFDYTESDKQKLAYISQLIEKYGWEIDSTIPDTERNLMLLKEDIYILEDFLKSFDYESNDLEKNTTSITRSSEYSTEEVLTSKNIGNGVWETKVHGHHTSKLFVSTSTIVVRYKYDEMFKVVSAGLTSTPKCTWTPDGSYYQINKYKYEGTKIEFAAGGEAKAYGITRRVTMKAHINFNEHGLADEGCVDSCRY